MTKFGQKRKGGFRYGAGSHSKKHIKTLQHGAKRQGRNTRVITTTSKGKKYYKLYETKSKKK